MTGNLLGEPFKDYVKGQIKARQKVHGSGFNGTTRTPEQLHYLNSKTSWLKLASSVKVLETQTIKPTDAAPSRSSVILEGTTVPGGEKRLDDKGISSKTFLGDTLAKNAVLFNGLTAQGQPQRSGLTQQNSVWNNGSAYGLGGLDFGLQPMPGIISANVEHLNRGSIKKATIQIKAHNKGQFDIIEILYLRLGFTMLLEWGNSSFINNQGNKEEIITTLVDNYFFQNSGASHLQILKEIEKVREIQDGNYDAFFGKVSNFSWSFNTDGSYDITLQMISLGDVIESINTNVLQPKGYEYEEDNSQKQDIISNFLKSLTVNNDLRLARENKASGLLGAVAEGFSGNIEELEEQSKELYFDYDSIKDYLDFEVEDFINHADKLDYVSPYIGRNRDPEELYPRYITFGGFLTFLQQYVIPQVENTNSVFPCIEIKRNTEANLMKAEEYQFSLDPRICIVKNNFLPKFVSDDSTKTNIEELFKPLKPWCEVGKQGFLHGKIMNIYLNFHFITSTVENHLDKKGNLNLYTLLDALCRGVNTALGGINNLEVVVDEEVNSITILEQNPIPGRIKQPDISPVFELFGYNNGVSNFVKNFSFQTEITPDLATTITIGATANAKVVGEDATAFSKWNSGFEDRFKQGMASPNYQFTTTEQSKKEEEGLYNSQGGLTNKGIRARERKKKKETLQQLAEYNRSNLSGYLVEAFGGTVDKPTTKSGSSTLTIAKSSSEYIKSNPSFIKRGMTVIKNKINTDSVDELNKENKPSSTIGFIPLKLSLEIDGISGIKIYQKLVINSKHLPGNYGDSLEFLVRGVSHSLEGNNWVTKLDTISIPKIK